MIFFFLSRNTEYNYLTNTLLYENITWLIFNSSTASICLDISAVGECYWMVVTVASVYIVRSEALPAVSQETLMLVIKSQRAKVDVKGATAPRNGSETCQKLLLPWASLKRLSFYIKVLAA